MVRSARTRGANMLDPRPGAPRAIRLALIGLLAAAMSMPVLPAAAEPDDATIDQLRSRSASVASQVATLDVQIGQLEADVEDAWQAVAEAGEDYTQATVELGHAKSAAKSADERYQASILQRELSRQVLVELVRDTSRNAAGATSLNVFFNASDFQDAVAGATAIGLVEGKAQRAVQQYEADSVVADTLKAAAERSVADLSKAKKQAERALQAAEDEQERAEQLQTNAAAQREQLVAELAQLRQSTVAAERERQERLQRERDRAREEAARQAQRDREAANNDADRGGNSGRSNNDSGSNSGGGNSGGNSGGGNSGSNTGGNESNGNSGGGNSGGNSGGGNSGGNSGSGNSGGNSGGGNSGGNSGGGNSGGNSGGGNSGGNTGGGNSGGGNSGGGNSGGDTGGGDSGGNTGGGNSGDLLGQGTSVSTAAQGRAAVTAARKQLGVPYGWGATGPGAFDCSGLTQHSWGIAGVSLQRTSRSQYIQVKKIAMANMRPGDLLFWGSNPNDPQSIWHVAMYIGPGQMIEAPRPGDVVKISPIRYTNLMPYAGRP